MFDFISKIVRIIFLIAWIPASTIVVAPCMIIIGMAMGDDWNFIKECIYKLILLK